MKYSITLLIGLLFGLGLVISGMVNPAKVLGFLDIAGDWDASLAFVMGGAVVVTTLGFRFVLNQRQPLFEAKFLIPNITAIDMPLISGAVLFGLGWGLVGLCPGPAIAALGSLSADAAIFFVAMLVGMLFPSLVRGRTSADQTDSNASEIGG